MVSRGANQQTIAVDAALHTFGDPPRVTATPAQVDDHQKCARAFSLPEFTESKNEFLWLGPYLDRINC